MLYIRENNMKNVFLVWISILLISCNKNTQNQQQDIYSSSNINVSEEIHTKNNDGSLEEINREIDGLYKFSSIFPEVRYVNSRDGLRVRSNPSINSDRIGVFLHGERIIVYAKTENAETIDGITDYWYSTRPVNIKDRIYTSWVFGGYLSEYLPSDAPTLLGLWKNIALEREFFSFQPNLEFMTGYFFSSNAVGGTWYLEEDIITINLTKAGADADDGEMNSTFRYQLIINDLNNITLLQSNRIVNLIRTDDDLIYERMYYKPD